MIHFCREPDFSLEIVSGSLVRAVSERGCPAREAVVGRDGIGFVSGMDSPNRAKKFLVKFGHTHLFSRRALAQIKAGDVVVVYETASIASRFFDASFQRAVVGKGAAYVPVFPDAWPLAGGWISDCCRRRVRLATIVGCVTPALTRLFRERFPGKRVELFEEASMTESFRPDWHDRNPVVICWSGPPHKIGEVRKILPVLDRVSAQHDFVLRIVSGTERPKLSASFPVDWRPFSRNRIGDSFAGASIAFALYDDTPYFRCKGNYKIKTYLSAGCAVVTNPVGYNLDMIEPAVNGLFATSPNEWEGAFVRLLENPEERLAMQRAARETAVKRFSFPAVAGRYVETLRDAGLIGSSGRMNDIVLQKTVERSQQP